MRPSLHFGEFHSRDRPSAFVTRDRDSQAVQLVQKDLIDAARLSVRQHHSLTHEPEPRQLEVAKDSEGNFLPSQRVFFSNGLTPSHDGNPKASRR